MPSPALTLRHTINLKSGLGPNPDSSILQLYNLRGHYLPYSLSLTFLNRTKGSNMRSRGMEGEKARPQPLRFLIQAEEMLGTGCGCNINKRI